MPRRVRLWKVGAIVLGLIAAIALAFWFWVDSVASRQWEAALRRLEEIRKEAQARRPVRKVLRGEPIPGNAWDDYTAALGEARKLASPGKALALTVLADPRSDPVKAVSVVQAGAAAIVHFRKGARRETSDYPAELESVSSRARRGLDDDFRLLTCLALAQARVLDQEGRSREAAEVLLDYFQFMRDLWADGGSGGRHSASLEMCIVLDEVQALIMSGSFSREDFLALDGQCQVLDSEFPSALFKTLGDLVGDGETVVSMRVNSDRLQEAGWNWLKTWRFAFSERLIKIDAIRRIDQCARLTVSLEGRPYHEVFMAYEGVVAEDPEYPTRNPLWTSHGHKYWGSNERIRLTQIRLLRMAVHFRATGEVLDLEDPYGNRLVHSVTGGHLKAWSWANGRTSGPRPGQWKPLGDPVSLSIETDR